MELSLTNLLALLVLPLLMHGFRVPSPIGKSGSAVFFRQRSSHRIRCFAGKDGGESGGDDAPGMEDAFRELEALQSLGDNDNKFREMTEGGKAAQKDEAFAAAMDKLDLKDILSQAATDSEKAGAPSPESEVELYKDMASELDVASSEEDLIAEDFRNDLELADSSETGVPVIDTKTFMKKAINEALEEAKDRDGSVDIDEAKEAFLDNKEIMSEIEKIFEKANDGLLEELEEIRAEQAELAKEQAERNSKANLEKIEENERRMEVAQGNMKKMLERVNTETRAVEEAVEDLKRAQAASEGGMASQLAGLKSGGLVKQAFLAGGLLFTLRSGAETVAFLAGDPSHVLPALVQGVLAILCIAGFVFL